MYRAARLKLGTPRPRPQMRWWRRILPLSASRRSCPRWAPSASRAAHGARPMCRARPDLPRP